VHVLELAVGGDCIAMIGAVKGVCTIR